MTDIREEAIGALATAIINCIDETNSLPSMQTVKNWLDDEYGLGDEAADLLISMLARVVK